MSLSYQDLVAQLGKPTTDRKVIGMVGYRFDEWPCGCLRAVRMGNHVGYIPVNKEGQRIMSMTTSFHPCEEHREEFAEKEVI